MLAACEAKLANGSSINDIMAYLLNNTKSMNSCLVHISRLKQRMRSNGLNMDGLTEGRPGYALLTEGRLYQLIKQGAMEEQRRSLDNRAPREMPPELNKDQVVRVIEAYLNGDVGMSNEVLTMAIIALSARPAELLKLSIENGSIRGWLKQRGKDRSMPYAGVLELDIAVKLIEKLKSLKDGEYDLGNASNLARYRRWLKQKKNLQARDLRAIGANIAMDQAEGRISRLMMRRNALRHACLDTSIIHYNI